ncbi:hypothetical protein EVAR_41857_1 [Eumeta japonica]|uniref:Uncharacterized protein n=1 Tax=Eumeta variegata TaxID=151549 RepID=A0A4C1XCX7_EUMVA|nr:hypothetical protein EVAR_41857_1 [Eumeta japonica]
MVRVLAWTLKVDVRRSGASRRPSHAGVRSRRPDRMRHSPFRSDDGVGRLVLELHNETTYPSRVFTCWHSLEMRIDCQRSSGSNDGTGSHDFGYDWFSRFDNEVKLLTLELHNGQHILVVYGLVGIVLRCILTMNGLQGLMMKLEFCYRLFRAVRRDVARHVTLRPDTHIPGAAVAGRRRGPEQIPCRRDADKKLAKSMSESSVQGSEGIITKKCTIHEKNTFLLFFHTFPAKNSYKHHRARISAACNWIMLNASSPRAAQTQRSKESQRMTSFSICSCEFVTSRYLTVLTETFHRDSSTSSLHWAATAV